MIKSLRYQLPHAAWQLELHSVVLEHMDNHRQTSFWKKEAGGQLYAKSLTAAQIEVSVASGPYPGDLRSRHRYTMKGEAATSDREYLFKQGFTLCGLWHTHPEPNPFPSGPDLNAVKDNLALLPEWETLLLVIQGTLPGPDGLFVGVYHRNLELTQMIELSDSVLLTR